MSNVQPAPLSYEDLANQVLLLIRNFLAIELVKGMLLGCLRNFADNLLKLDIVELFL